MGKAERRTPEVDITVEVNIDGSGQGNVETGIGFLNHMLVSLGKHALFDLKVKAAGELKHHVSEDVALALGKALKDALRRKEGIRRFGSAYVPMDDSLARCVVDLSGRAYSNIDLKLSGSKIEDLNVEDIEHFLASFAQALEFNLHVAVLYGSNDHHKAEAAVKALALALREAVALEPRMRGQVPSAKGVL
jgi:imidazoleglycerol phosphate dehydratase HisB